MDTGDQRRWASRTRPPRCRGCFYGTLFGWAVEDMKMGQGTYTVVKAIGAGIGGIMKRPPNAPTHRPTGGPT